MLPDKYQWIGVQFEPGEGDPWALLTIARELEAAGDLTSAATVYDRAFGLEPAAAEIRAARLALLDRLAVVEHGLRFRYVPAGMFLMGRSDGEPDEGPWHPVWLSPFWMSETPISWATYCRLMSWEPPPQGFPRDLAAAPPGGFDAAAFHLYQENKIRLQYCEDHTTRAHDWHAHLPPNPAAPGGSAAELFGSPPRTPSEAPWRYETKPMVAVGWEAATELADRLSAGGVRYALPTEAQWEKAARGGLIGARHAWGDEPPTHDCCDFDRFREFSIRPMTTFAPNGYGLYAVNGGVWEWVRDWYDRDAYQHTPDRDPEGPPDGKERVLRGGSWADCADVVTVTYRMACVSRSWRDGEWGNYLTPNIGFRLCRTAAAADGTD